jgi:hypothetical protein
MLVECLGPVDQVVRGAAALRERGQQGSEIVTPRIAAEGQVQGLARLLGSLLRREDSPLEMTLACRKPCVADVKSRLAHPVSVSFWHTVTTLLEGAGEWQAVCRSPIQQERSERTRMRPRLARKQLTIAFAGGWTVVDMKHDWKVIYPFQR